MTIFLRVWLVVCAMLLVSGVPDLAAAFTLGELQLLSKPGQPFQAMAPITLDPEEAIVAVDMGADADYQLLNLSRKAVVNTIATQLKEQDGHLFVVLQSTKPVREKDFHVLLRVSSNHHTYFPFFRVRPLTMAGNQEHPAQKTVDNPATPAKEMQATDDAQPGSTPKNRMYGPVRGKERLRDVARRLQKGSRFSVVQVEVALWQRNPTRFIRNNMNGLKAGSRLIVPLPEEIAQVDKQEAKQLRLSHAREWKKSPKESMHAVADAAATVGPEKGRVVPNGHAAAKKPVNKHPKKLAKKTAKKMNEDLAKKSDTDSLKKDEEESPVNMDEGQVKIEGGALQAILVQLQVITHVLEDHHDRQEQLEKRVSALEKSQEQREQLEKRVSLLERSMKEWHFLTKDQGADSGNGKDIGVPVAVSPAPKGTP
ncbi:MAG: hypothetical protein HQL87_15935 [Magnetococcales bacterium]|nr:hypothetical protein [Magnetococcales bacterium]